MKTIIAIAILIGTINLNAQSIERQVIGSTGGTAISGTIIVTSTTGESVINTFGGTLILTQGYQQATVSSTVSIKEMQVEANYKLYPNPTTINETTLDITTLNLNANATVDLYTSEGKLISNQKINLQSGVKTTITFNLNDKEAGIYFIKIFDSKSKLAKTLKLIKE